MKQPKVIYFEMDCCGFYTIKRSPKNGLTPYISVDHINSLVCPSSYTQPQREAFEKAIELIKEQIKQKI